MLTHTRQQHWWDLKSTIPKFPNSQREVFPNLQQIGNFNIDLKNEILFYEIFEKKFLKDLNTQCKKF